MPKLENSPSPISLPIFQKTLPQFLKNETERIVKAYNVLSNAFNRHGVHIDKRTGGIMQPSGSQTGLKVISILDIIGGVFIALSAFMMLAGGAIIGTDPNAAAEAAAEIGMEASTVVGIATWVGVMLLVSAAITLITGILGLRAAKDNQKVKPVWIISIIALVFAVISFIMTITGGGDSGSIGSSLGGLVMPAITFWLANNVKKEAGL